MAYGDDLSEVGLKPNHTNQQTGKHFPLMGNHKWEWLDKWIQPHLGYSKKKLTVAYVDGACSEQGIEDIAKAGFGLWYGQDHPWNEWSTFYGR